jgi:hypothetical protein
MDNQPVQEEEDTDGLPPMFKTWKQLYITLIGYLFVLIMIFYWFTLAFK